MMATSHQPPFLLEEFRRREVTFRMRLWNGWLPQFIHSKRLQVSRRVELVRDLHEAMNSLFNPPPCLFRNPLPSTRNPCKSRIGAESEQTRSANFIVDRGA